MLTDAKVRNARPTATPQKLSDGKGLYLHITPAGSKLWRWRYMWEGREKLLSLGRYPALSLADARSARDAARVLLDGGKDPSVAKQEAAAAAPGRTFEVIARQWHDQQKVIWTAKHSQNVLDSLEAVFPDLGSLDISAITPPQVLSALRKIEDRGAIETAKRTRQRISAIFVFAIASGLCEQDPAAVIGKALKPLIKGHQPAVIDLNEARDVLRIVEATPSYPVTKLALRFLALTAVRPGELRGARWTEFAPDPLSLDEPERQVQWVIPAERMKMKREHVVPLSRQAVAVLRAVRPFSRTDLVFPMSTRATKPISENALGYLLNRAGYYRRHVPHGWRATFSSVMNERFPADRAVIDLMLAHINKDRTEAVYNRAQFMDRRRELAQAWADLLMEGAVEPDVLVGLRRRS